MNDYFTMAKDILFIFIIIKDYNNNNANNKNILLLFFPSTLRTLMTTYNYNNARC